MLYTGAGDDGKTKLFACDQQRISKSSEVPEALGALDELNAFLGFIRTRTADSERIGGAVLEMQENLFIIQAEVSGADKKIEVDTVKKIEKMISDIEKEMPTIKSFTIAGGTELSALLDVARAIARRAERRVIAVKEKKLCELSNETMAYLNRLSSLLFALARLANHIVGVAEEAPNY